MQRMRLSLFSLSILASLLLVSVPKASADTFSFAVSAPLLGYTGSGTLFAVARGDGSYRVTGASGGDVAGLLAAGAYNGNTNLLFPSSTQALDTSGLALTMLYGSDVYQVDLFASPTGYMGLITTPQAFTLLVPVALTLQAQQTGPSVQAVTPEPRSLLLLGTGLLVTALLALRRAAHKDQFRHA